MNFEHLVQINDPANPMLESLSREQLWRGLWQRVENPMIFLSGLETCHFLERDELVLVRQLDFGNACIRDRVTFAEQQWLRFEIEPGPGHAGGVLTITLEEPQPETLFLRFNYSTTMALDGEDGRYAEYVKSAYRESDLETVRVIRLLLAEGSVQ